MTLLTVFPNLIGKTLETTKNKLKESRIQELIQEIEEKNKQITYF